MEKDFRDLVGEHLLTMMMFIPEEANVVKTVLRKLHVGWGVYPKHNQPQVLKNIAYELAQCVASEREFFAPELYSVYSDSIMTILKA